MTYTAHAKEANESFHTWKLSRHTDKCIRASHVTRVIRQVAQTNTQLHGNEFIMSRTVRKKQCPCRIYDTEPSKDTWCINRIQRIRRETYGRCLNIKTNSTETSHRFRKRNNGSFQKGLFSRLRFWKSPRRYPPHPRLCSATLCCSALQCVAVRCSVLQSVAGCYSVL